MPNKLQVELALLDKLTSPLNRAAADINGITKRIEGAFKFVTAVGAITGLVAGMGALIDKSIEFAERIDDGSRRLQISAEAYQQWDTVLKNNGSSIENVSSGLSNLNKIAYLASAGQKKSAQAFKDLGVSVTDSNGKLRDHDELLNDTIFKLADVKNATLQSALAQKLFGGAGQELIPTLQGGSQALKDQLEQSKSYGIITGETASKLADAKDKMDHFKQSTSVLSAEFVNIFIPKIGQATEALAKFLAKLPEIVRGKSEFTKESERLKKEIDDLKAKLDSVSNGEDPLKIFGNEDNFWNAKERLTWLKNYYDKFKKENGPDANRGGDGSGGSGGADAAEIEKAAKKRLETWIRVSKEINEKVREENYAETQKLWEASHLDLGAKGSKDVELPEYLKENSPLTQNILKRKDIIVKSNEEIAQSYIDTGMRISSAIGTMVSLQNNMTENRIAKMRAEGTLTKENEQDFREHMRRRQGVLAAIAIAEAAGAAVSSVYKAWKDGGSWYEALAKSIAGGLEVAAVTATQVNSIKAASFAGGVRDYQGGYALVGEQGPEMRYLPPGSSVYTAHETNRMMNQPQNILNWTSYDTQGVVTKEVERALRSGEFDTALRMMERRMGRS